MAKAFSISTMENPASPVDRAKGGHENGTTSTEMLRWGVPQVVEDKANTRYKITVTVTDKPFFLSWDNVESRAERFCIELL